MPAVALGGSVAVRRQPRTRRRRRGSITHRRYRLTHSARASGAGHSVSVRASRAVGAGASGQRGRVRRDAWSRSSTTSTPRRASRSSIDGEPVVAVNETLPLRPASNVKLITASVALEVLGPEFKYTTTIKGVLAGGVVHGNLYFVGGGDPVLNSVVVAGPEQELPAVQSHFDRGAGRLDQGGRRHRDHRLGRRRCIALRQRVVSTELGKRRALHRRWSGVGAAGQRLARERRRCASKDPVVGAATVLTHVARRARHHRWRAAGRRRRTGRRTDRSRRSIRSRCPRSWPRC